MANATIIRLIVEKNSFSFRLKEERERIGYKNQSDIAELIGISREMWGKYERGQAIPGGDIIAILISIGFDINYILTGHRSVVMTEEEKILIDLWRSADFLTKHTALQCLTQKHQSASNDRSAT